jgi:hypothetical protein
MFCFFFRLDNDRDGLITYEDFVRAVKKDALLLQACGPCIPSTRCASAFQSLISERYHMQSALYPKMPFKKNDIIKKHDTNKKGDALKNFKKPGRMTHSWRGRMDLKGKNSSQATSSTSTNQVGSVVSVVDPSTANLNIPVAPRASRKTDGALDKMSLSVAKHMERRSENSFSIVRAVEQRLTT